MIFGAKNMITAKYQYNIRNVHNKISICSGVYLLIIFIKLNDIPHKPG